MLEKRYAIIEARAEGLKLSGTVMPYNAEAKLPFGREKFMPGAFGPEVAQADVTLNRQHVRAMPLARTQGGGLVLIDDPETLRMTADLPDTAEARDAVELVRSKVLRGLSVEFAAVRERMEGDLRIIERANLVGLALVDSGQYDDATVQAREAASVNAGLYTQRRRMLL